MFNNVNLSRDASVHATIDEMYLEHYRVGQYYNIIIFLTSARERRRYRRTSR